MPSTESLRRRARTRWRTIIAFLLLAAGCSAGLYFAVAEKVTREVVKEQGSPCVRVKRGPHAGEPSEGCRRIARLVAEQCRKEPRLCLPLLRKIARTPIGREQLRRELRRALRQQRTAGRGPGRRANPRRPGQRPPNRPPPTPTPSPPTGGIPPSPPPAPRPAPRPQPPVIPPPSVPMPTLPQPPIVPQLPPVPCVTLPGGVTVCPHDRLACRSA